MKRFLATSTATLAALALLTAALFAGAPALAQDASPTDGMVFGAPEAEVFEEDYDGPPVVGEYLTMHPELAELDYEGNTTHEVRLDIIAQEIEVAPDVRFTAWTFGGTVPGPVLHVREGDRVVFTMKNRSDEEVAVAEPAGLATAAAAAALTPTEEPASPFMEQVAERNNQKAEPAVAPMQHSMDFHSATVDKADKYRNVQPGETIRFEWTANYPGQYMYHCGTPPMLQHIAMGQYGLVVVSPKDGYPTDSEVDREYTITQSEFYLKEGTGENHAMDLEAAMDARPSLVAFNGHRDALSEEPLRARAGERVRLHVLNAGPSQTSSFHVVGAIFDRVYYEGHPQNEWFGMQTVLLGASNGAVVEFIAPEEGEYVLVDHQFADAMKGATGKLIVSE